MEKIVNELVEKYKRYTPVELIYLIEDDDSISVIIVEKSNQRIERFITYDNAILGNVCKMDKNKKSFKVLYDRFYNLYLKEEKIRSEYLKNGDILYDREGKCTKIKEKMLSKEKSRKCKKLV